MRVKLLKSVYIKTFDYASIAWAPNINAAFYKEVEHKLGKMVRWATKDYVTPVEELFVQLDILRPQLHFKFRNSVEFAKYHELNHMRSYLFEFARQENPRKQKYDTTQKEVQTGMNVQKELSREYRRFIFKRIDYTDLIEPSTRSPPLINNPPAPSLFRKTSDFMKDQTKRIADKLKEGPEVRGNNRLL